MATKENSASNSNTAAAAKATAAPKKKKDFKIASGVLHVHASDNNTIITLTDENGNKVLGWWTGLIWYKWSKKNTPYAAEVLTKQLLKEGQGYWLKEIGIVFRGIGISRDGIFKAVNEVWLVDLKYVREHTAIQFGGCKGKRPKRI